MPTDSGGRGAAAGDVCVCTCARGWAPGIGTHHEVEELSFVAAMTASLGPMTRQESTATETTAMYGDSDDDPGGGKMPPNPAEIRRQLQRRQAQGQCRRIVHRVWRGFIFVTFGSVR